jgi:hypothetical protein
MAMVPKLSRHDMGVGVRRIVLITTAGVVAVLAVFLVALRWDSANKLAVVVSAVSAAAAVGVAIWAALPTVSASAKGVRVARTGRATAGPGGRANSGVSGTAGSLPVDALVEKTGDADASNGGDANSGIQVN